MADKKIGVVIARGKTHVQRLDENGHPYNEGGKKRHPYNKILSDEQIERIWAEEKGRGRA